MQLPVSLLPIVRGREVLLALTCIAATFLEVAPRVDDDFFIVVFALLFVMLDRELLKA